MNSQKKQKNLGDCKCNDWKVGMQQIMGAQALAHSHGIVYTAKAFIFCPWCGEKRPPAKKEKT